MEQSPNQCIAFIRCILKLDRTIRRAAYGQDWCEAHHGYLAFSFSDKFYPSSLHDRGLALVQFPEGLGGLGLSSRRLQTAVDAELRSAGVTYHDLNINPIGIGMGAPVVLTYASEEQKVRLLRPMYTGEEIWCQLFSEPAGGSDLAALRTRAARDGDDWSGGGHCLEWHDAEVLERRRVHPMDLWQVCRRRGR